ncbi:MAG: hypothetical protein F4X65_10835 [Chloroflexi bacterium]|nr:hypothetical protein [Chloroflexota bacterium]
MLKTFAEMLKKIGSQANVLSELEERAVELGVVIPVLRQLGWDTDLVTEVFPQQTIRMVNNPGGYGQVDYALQIDRRLKVLLEIKRWSVELARAHQEQLNRYCTAASASAHAPELAVLTNGRQWRLYRTHWSRIDPPPIGEISEFLRFDIINNDPLEVETHFRKYLERKQFLGRRVW